MIWTSLLVGLSLFPAQTSKPQAPKGVLKAAPKEGPKAAPKGSQQTKAKTAQKPKSQPKGESKKKQIPKKKLSPLEQWLGKNRVLVLGVSQVSWVPEGPLADRKPGAMGFWAIFRRGRLVDLIPREAKELPLAKEKIRAKVADLGTEKIGNKGPAILTPAFVDACSTQFLSSSALSDPKLLAGTSLASSLEPWQQGYRPLLSQEGFSAFYVPGSPRTSTTGPGALVVVDAKKGFLGSASGSVWMRLSSPNSPGNNLSRDKVVKPLEGLLEKAKKYGKAWKKYEKDLAEYKKKRTEFLAYYKKHPLKPGEKITSAPKPKPTVGRRRRRPLLTPELIQKILKRYPPQIRDRVRKQLERQMKLQQEALKKAKAKGVAKKPVAKKSPTKTSTKAPKRPAYPKKPKRDLQMEAFKRVLEGKLGLIVELHRAKEILALLNLAHRFSLKHLTIAGATEAWKVAGDIRGEEANVLLIPRALPEGSPIPANRLAIRDQHWAFSAATLAKEGVPVALGSGGRLEARLLPAIAARATTFGISERDAIAMLGPAAIKVCGILSKRVAPLWMIWKGDPLSPGSKPIYRLRRSKLQKIEEQQ